MRGTPFQARGGSPQPHIASSGSGGRGRDGTEGRRAALAQPCSELEDSTR